ncbi:MAG: PhzF family phenazine biosynthesis protein [Pseudomonadota bacterium]|nr:PhzF family phenazine biosynthesis protein [Pseudomonadota bacterium]
MELPLYQVDAFASRVFEGNPAAVVPLSSWLPDATLQAVAAENNLAETAFFVQEEADYRIRWFTPTVEVKLCGHATLAAAFILYERMGESAPSIEFQSLSGPLSVSRQGARLTLDFPAQPGSPCDPPAALLKGLGVEPQACLASEDYLVVLESEAQVLALQPDMEALKALDLRGVAVTAPGTRQDFVVRFFAPRCGIPEDPVTGSAYTELAPYWSRRLDKLDLTARQVSPRGGDVVCSIEGDRVKISGSACLYLEGSIYV